MAFFAWWFKCVRSYWAHLIYAIVFSRWCIPIYSNSLLFWSSAHSNYIFFYMIFPWYNHQFRAYLTQKMATAWDIWLLHGMHSCWNSYFVFYFEKQSVYISNWNVDGLFHVILCGNNKSACTQTLLISARCRRIFIKRAPHNRFE